MSAHVRERLSPYLDGELDLAERSTIDAHLAQCPACAAALEELALVDSAVAGLPLQDAQGDDMFAARVRARILSEGARAGRGPSARRGLPAWTWAAAAALLVAVLTPVTLRELRLSGARPALDAVAPPAAPAGARDGRGPVASRGNGAPLEAEPEAVRKGRAEPQPAKPLGYAEHESAAAPPPALPSPGSTGKRDKAGGAPLSAATARQEATAQQDAGQFEGGGGGGFVGAVADTRRAFAAAPQEPTPQREAAAKQERSPAGAPAALEESARLRAALPAAPAAGSPGKASDAGETSSFGRLEEQRPQTAEEWRRLRAAWRELAHAQPDRARADAALVRAIDAAAAAFRASGDARDERVLERDVSEYLGRKDAAEGDRVRRLLRETR